MVIKKSFQIDAIRKLANQRMSPKHQFENVPKTFVVIDRLLGLRLMAKEVPIGLVKYELCNNFYETKLKSTRKKFVRTISTDCLKEVKIS